MSHFADALRLVVGRAPNDPHASLSPRAILGVLLGLVLIDVAVQRVLAGGEAQFSLYGVNALIACFAVNLAMIAMFTRQTASGAQLRQFILLSAATSVLLFAVMVVSHGINALGFQKAAAYVVIGALLLAIVSTILGARRIFRLAEARWPTAKSFGFTACAWIAVLALPNWPVFFGPDFKSNEANVWESVNAAQRDEPTAEQKAEWAKKQQDMLTQISGIEAAQPYLLDAELAGLTPRAPKKPNIFVIGVGGWSDQKVFLRETEASLDIIRKSLHAEGKTVELVNNKETATAHPIANIQNLTHVLRGVAAKMNLEDDILLLTMTSHGSEQGFALEYEPFVDRTLQPEALRALLDAAGIKNRIVIVSACHSGVFVPALSNPRSVVITAARAERASFGCADNRDWTYFGDAFFAHGLTETPRLTEAFAKARMLVAQWEKEQKVEPSEPQIFVGAEIARQFPRIVGGETAAAPIQASPQTPSPAIRSAPLRGRLRSATR